MAANPVKYDRRSLIINGQRQFIIPERFEQPPQRYYHIPPDWLEPGENLLVVCEERGAEPGPATLVRRR